MICPNCESTMNDGDACPECDHDDRLSVYHCDCRWCQEQAHESVADSDVYLGGMQGAD